MYLANYPLTPTMRSVEDRFSVKYYLNLVITDMDDNRYFKQQVGYRCADPVLLGARHNSR